MGSEWIQSNGGPLLVRWVYADDEADVWAAADGVDDCDFDAQAPGSFVVGPAGRCVLLDAADAGCEIEGEHLTISLRPGTTGRDGGYLRSYSLYTLLR